MSKVMEKLKQHLKKEIGLTRGLVYLFLFMYCLLGGFTIVTFFEVTKAHCSSSEDVKNFGRGTF